MEREDFIGTAGWSIPGQSAGRFPDDGTQLQRYAQVLCAAEVNSSFYRSHAHATYQRWAASTPPEFRFSVKCPEGISHWNRLRDCAAQLQRFVGEIAGLGPKLGVVLVQLPPTLVLDPTVAVPFFQQLRAMTHASIACEPRHSSWFDPAAGALLKSLRVARVAADPVVAGGSPEPGGWKGLVYFRLHGSPRRYYSSYDDGALAQIQRKLDIERRAGSACWCILDNTADGAAIENALLLSGMESAKGALACSARGPQQASATAP